MAAEYKRWLSTWIGKANRGASKYLGIAVQKTLSDFLPGHCVQCNTALAWQHSQRGICSHCWPPLLCTRLAQQACCRYCALPIDPNTSCSCANSGFAFQWARSGFVYQGAIRDLILRFKYASKQDLAPSLGALLSAAVTNDTAASSDPADVTINWREHLLIPIPLSPARLAERGFNQSTGLAHEFCRQLPRSQRPKVHASLLRRSGLADETQHQANLTKAERFGHMQRAFHVKGNAARTQSLILIDDVMTTGATLHAAASALREAGFSKIGCLVLARTTISPYVQRRPSSSRDST